MRPSMTTVRTGGAVDGLEAGPMTAATWGCCPALRRPGELLTRSDVCWSGAMRFRTSVYRVAWSLSSTASGRLRRRPPSRQP